MRIEQSGQALAGVMVVMLIVFALAGAVAVAASALLVRQGGSRNAFTEDFTAQSAVTDALAQVAGSTTMCNAPPAPPAVLPIAFPKPDALAGTDSSQIAICSRSDRAAPGAPDYLSFDWSTSLPGARCLTTALPASSLGKRVDILFNARSTTGGWAYVDGTTSDQNCPVSLSSIPLVQCPAPNSTAASSSSSSAASSSSPSPSASSPSPSRASSSSASPSPSPSSSSFPSRSSSSSPSPTSSTSLSPSPSPSSPSPSPSPLSSTCTPCKQPAFQPIAQSSIAQVVLACDLTTLPSGSRAYLHVRNTLRSPYRGFLSLETNQGSGSMYLIAAATNLGSGRDYEEAVMFVGSGLSQLRYRASIP